MCQGENMAHESDIPYGGMLSWGSVPSCHDFLEINLGVDWLSDFVHADSMII